MLVTQENNATNIADITFPIARYRFTAKVNGALRMPGYSGSLLRGQFGAALRDLACMTRQPTCNNCPLLQTCPYIKIFEALPSSEHSLQKFSHIPNAYVIEPPLATDDLAPFDLFDGDELVFNMVLFGQCVSQLALIIFAWQKAFKRGLSKEKIPLELLKVEYVGEYADEVETVWSSQTAKLLPHQVSLTADCLPNFESVNAATLQTLRLHIYTPLRIQNNGTPLGANNLNPKTFITTLARRFTLLMEFHAGQSHGDLVPAISTLAEQIQVQSHHNLKWHNWIRYSSRQQQEMNLGGVIGTWDLTATQQVWQIIWPWIYLGQWAHVGKNATMGMGHYSAEFLE